MKEEILKHFSRIRNKNLFQKKIDTQTLGKQEWPWNKINYDCSHIMQSQAIHLHFRALKAQINENQCKCKW